MKLPSVDPRTNIRRTVEVTVRWPVYSCVSCGEDVRPAGHHIHFYAEGPLATGHPSFGNGARGFEVGDRWLVLCADCAERRS